MLKFKKTIQAYSLMSFLETLKNFKAYFKGYFWKILENFLIIDCSWLMHSQAPW
jgi:hypothetical protein